MALQKYNARDVEFQVEDFASPGTWIAIGGLDTFTKGHSEETTDTTTFASQGQEESQKMQIGKTLGLQGKRLRDSITGAGDPGQAKVEGLNERLGEESLGRIRFSHKNDTTWTVWTARVSLGDQGGGNNDKVSWEATFTRSGAETTAAKP
ncbi:phage tail tube protein [Streptomyces sp. NPDC057253]|uniref:phage tail tube protein n=1 Tax=Streptomyces sp. NPDC057253 TaxID=3346069 RepID=UPI003625FD6F